MRTEELEKTKDLIKTLHKENLLWMFMGSLVSSDNLTIEKDYESSLLILKDIKESLPLLEEDLGEETFNKLSKVVNDEQHILEYDLKALKNKAN